MADDKFVAIRAIDHPIGSGVWAYQPGDDVPAGNVKAHGYDKDQDGAGPRVAKANSKAAEKAADAPVASAAPVVEDKSAK